MRGMKKTILLIFLAISNFVYSQSILGVMVGSSYEDTKKTLEDRFGRYIKEDKGNLTIYDFDMGTFHFNSGTLCFQWKERDSKFFRAEFQKWSGTRNAESMKAEREYLKQLMASKYKIFEFKNSQGFICYEFLGEEMNGITMHGEISLARTKGKDNIERLYLFLIYYPIADFIEENSDF